MTVGSSRKQTDWRRLGGFLKHHGQRRSYRPQQRIVHLLAVRPVLGDEDWRKNKADVAGDASSGSKRSAKGSIGLNS
jgi:hypothetical protein